MSEYQYYEFQAIDRPLSPDQIAELRTISTRATISPTRFVNVYNYGDFRGDPLELVERYFDAHVYVANWGTHQLMLGFPRQVLDPELVRPYACDDSGLSVHVRGDRVMLEFIDQDEDGGDWEDGEEWMPSLIQLRSDIAGADLRALYLGWLHSAQWEEPDEDAVEPLLPPGLGNLTAPLKALAEFLRIDEDLIAVAAERSGPLAELRPSSSELERWIRDLPESEKNVLLLRLAEGELHLQAELLRRFREATAPPSSSPADDPGDRRTVAELLAAAEAHGKARRRAQAEREARERARREREQALARAAYLETLVGQEEAIWRQVEPLVETKRPQEYDRAVELLTDLRDLAARSQETAVFESRLSDLRARHAKKPSLLARLDRAGLSAGSLL